jgi:hypothetical protein
MSQDARVLLLANGGGSNLRSAWSDNPAASWAGTATANMPQWSNTSGSTWARAAYSPTLNMIVAISNGGENSYNGLATSGDGGNTWVARYHPSGTSNVWTFNDVCWCPGLALFVVVASAGPTSSSRVMTSPDGINWTTQTLPNTGVSLNGVACGSISGSDYIVAVGSSNAIYTSTDGVTWTSQTGPGTSKNWAAICWASGQSKFVAIATGGGGSNDEMYSSNGTSWSQTTCGPGWGYSWTNIAYSADLDQMVVVGGNSAIIVYSTAGSVTSWTQLTSVASLSDPFAGICWSHDYSVWVACSPNGSTVITSPNSSTWTSQTHPNTNTWSVALAIPASTVVANNLGLDYYYQNSYRGEVGAMSGFNGVSTKTMTINTTQTDEIILMFVEMEQLQATGAYAHVTSITSSGLTWAPYGTAYQYRGGRNGSSPYNYNTMEVWWAHAAAAQSAATVTINTSASVDNLSASAVGVIGANSTGPFDAAGLFVNNGGSSSSATTPTTTSNAVTFSKANQLVFAFSGAPRSISADYAPTGYNTVYMGGDPSGADWGYQEVAIGQPATALSAATVAFGGSYTVANWGMVVGALVPPSAGGATGTMSPSEAADAMSFTGTPTRLATMAPTEAADVMSSTLKHNAHPYWRLMIESNIGDSYTSVGELYMHSTPGGADICTGGTPIASAGTASLAFNRTDGDYWQATGSTQVWVGYHFAAPVVVQEFAVRFNSPYSGQAPKKFWLEWSDDGTVYRGRIGVDTSSSWSNPETRTYTLPVGPATSWAIRLRDAVWSTEWGPAYYDELQEIQFLDGSSSNLCTGGTAFADSVNGSYAAANAFDGNSGTRWQGTTGHGSELIGYTFTGAVQPASVTMKAWSGEEGGGPKHFEVAFSNDGVVFGVTDWAGGSDVYDPVTPWVAATMQTFVLSSTPLPARTGTLAVTEAIDTFAGTGHSTHNAAWSSSEAVDTASITGHRGHIGTWSSTEATDVSSEAGYLGLTGTMDVTEAQDTSDITGGPMSFSGIIGYLGPTEATDVFDAAGSAVAIAVMAVTEDPDVFHAFGKITIVGTFTPTEAKDVFSGAAHVAGQTGIWASNEPVDTAYIIGKVPRVGTWSSIENQDTAIFTGLGSTGTTARRIFFVT